MSGVFYLPCGGSPTGPAGNEFTLWRIMRVSMRSIWLPGNESGAVRVGNTTGVLGWGGGGGGGVRPEVPEPLLHESAERGGGTR